MFPRYATLALGTAAAVMLAACSGRGPAPPAAPAAPATPSREASASGVPRGHAPVAPGLEPGAVILAASSSGAVVADPATRSYRGYTSTGELSWVDRDAYRDDAEVVCAVRCPDAVITAAGRNGTDRVRLRTGTRARPMAQAAVHRVLAVRGPSDAVLVEDGRGGRGARIRVDRTDRTQVRVDVADTAGVLWVEDAGRSAALAVYRRPGHAGTSVLAFRRDGRGWRTGGPPRPVAEAWGGCLGGGRGPAILAGPRGTLLAHGTPAPLTSDLPQVGECAAGRDGAVLLARWIDAGGTAHTALRGVDATGRETWARDVPAEVEVAAHPSGRQFALSGQAGLEIVDQAGRPLMRAAGVSSARYTETGRLVVVDGAGTPRWAEPPRDG
ncbi:hypothetical protein [Microbispora triticiradicis]|uniref:hypothetical protein n=1 Tax=Microbispora triticiradicis TaxID=2200763 RepID=UPI001AD6FFD1|nr:hypothetical protein [Microbispora triticiradicis]MBO4271555.1 hypothetical protein [Microbispora triticiradicis]